MRCNICNNKLLEFVPDTRYRGGIRPCGVCVTSMEDAVMEFSFNHLLGYDESDPQIDIDETVKHNQTKREN